MAPPGVAEDAAWRCVHASPLLILFTAGSVIMSMQFLLFKHGFAALVLVHKHVCRAGS